MKLTTLLIGLFLADAAQAQRFYCQSDSDCGTWAHCYQGGQCIEDEQNGFIGANSLPLNKNDLIRKCITSAKNYADKNHSLWNSSAHYGGVLYNSCYVRVTKLRPGTNSCSYKYNVDMSSWSVRYIEDIGCGDNHY